MYQPDDSFKKSTCIQDTTRQISVPTLLVVRSVEGGVRIQSQFLFKFCKLNVQSLHGVSFAVVFVSTSLIW